MTEKQAFRLYFPKWRECCEANYWRTVKGAVLIDEARLNEWGKKVVTLAKQKGAGARPPHAATMDDLRHAAHIVAIGKDKSSKDLTNAELDRVLALFGLVTDQENLDASLDWDDPSRQEEKRLDWCLKNLAPDGYVRSICRGKFGVREWEGLTTWQKRQLVMTLKERKRSWVKPVSEKVGAGVSEPDPF